MDFEIIYQDNLLLVINKPSRITVEEISLKLKDQFSSLSLLGEENRYGLIHRLDKDTSGVLLFSKDLSYLKEIKERFKKREVQKKYLLLCWKRTKKEEGKIITYMKRAGKDRRKHSSFSFIKGGRRAETDYKVLEKFKNYSLIEAYPLTGRKHQLRSQFAYLGHPITGDKLYRFSDQEDPPGLERHFLHAESISLKTSKGKKEFHSPLPEDLKKIISNLRCQKN